MCLSPSSHVARAIGHEASWNFSLMTDDDRPSHRQANKTTPKLLVCIAFVPTLVMVGLWAFG